MVGDFASKCILLACLVCASSQNKARYEKAGDLVLGGLFPLHDFNHTVAKCGRPLRLNALRMVEAMAYAIDEVNRNETILPNVTIGYEIYDTCNYQAVAQQASLQFLPSQREFICRHSSPNDSYSILARASAAISDLESPLCAQQIVGVVGARRSSCSIQATTLTALSSIPQISYMSTDDDLSNTNKYPFFLRTVPPSRYQVKAMIDILLHFNWTYVSALHSDDSYGYNGIAVFERLASVSGICTATTMSLSSRRVVDYYDDVVHELLKYCNANVVIVFAQVEHVQCLMTSVVRMGAVGQFIWLASDGWGNYGLDILEGNQAAALGALLLRQYALPATDFEEHFYSSSPCDSENPWMEEYIREYGGDCSVVCDGKPNATFRAPGNESASVHQESLVIDSVRAFTNSMDAIFRERCHGNWDAKCNARISNGKLLMDYLLSVDFYGPNGRVEFDQNGEVHGKYFVDQIQLSAGVGFEIKTVGRWGAESFEEAGEFSIHEDFQWCNGTDCIRGNRDTPESTCSKPCQFGEARRVFIEIECCWVCDKCQNWEIIAENGSVCQNCSSVLEYSWPSEDKTECELIDPEYFHITDRAGIALATISSLGVVFTVFSVFFYITHDQHILIKASSRELSYIILSGVFLAYTVSYFFMMEPCTVVCFGQRWVGLALAMMYGTLTTKTNRVYRIFQSGKKSAKRPKFISPCSQIVISAIIISVQVILIIAGLIIKPPKAVLYMPDPTRPFVELKCVDTDIAVLIQASYVFALLVVCAYEAFKTRKLPNNYNESKFITFDVFTSLLVLLAFMLPYLLSKSSVYDSIYVVMALLVDASATLVCLFFPKIYAICFVRETDMKLGYSNSYRTALKSQVTQANSAPDPATDANPTVTPSLDHGCQEKQLTCCQCGAQMSPDVGEDEKMDEDKTPATLPETVTTDSDI